MIDNKKHHNPNPTQWIDWTIGIDNRCNTSPTFREISKRIARIVGNTRVSDNPNDVAGLILAQLAHKYHLSPADDTIDRLGEPW